jgi:hypothetical protein
LNQQAIDHDALRRHKPFATPKFDAEASGTTTSSPPPLKSFDATL